MSSEGKVPNPDDPSLDSVPEPVEAELADSVPVAEPAEELSSNAATDPEVVVAQTVESPTAGVDSDKTGDTRDTGVFEGREVPDLAAVALATAVGKTPAKFSPPPLAKNLQNLSANGGAVGALVLGAWCFLGSFITNWSIINGILGLLLGTWGLTSRRKKTAWIGIALCTIGILLCLAEFSEIVNKWMYEVDDTIVEQ